jgi:CRISPR-associated protein (TIGR02710 family)
VESGGERLFEFESPLDRRGLDALREVALHLNSRRYDSAVQAAKKAMPVLPPDLRPLFDAISAAARGYGLWERFDHSAARNEIKRAKVLLERHLPYRPDRACEAFLADLSRDHAFLDDLLSGTKKGRPTPLHLLDLLQNADRKADRGAYDDAGARLYRAIEMGGQIALWEGWRLDASAVPTSEVPEDLREEYARRYSGGDGEALKLPLMAVYRLLGAKGHEMGAIFEARWKELERLLSARNNSVLAHGVSPIKRETCGRMAALARDFLAPILPDSEGPAFPPLDFL